MSVATRSISVKNGMMQVFDWFTSLEGIIFTVASVGLLFGSVRQSLPFSLLETVGFITGALSVWFAVKERVLNWPIGILNNLCFFVLFAQVQLWGSVLTQVPFLAIAVWGWYQWLWGGSDHTGQTIKPLTWKMFIQMSVFLVVATPLLTVLFEQYNDPAPFLDAITTTMSLVAIYWMTTKVVQHWYLWIAADVIFIVLYASLALHLTAVLYVVFLLMSIVGYIQWKTKLRHIAQVQGVSL